MANRNPRNLNAVTATGEGASLDTLGGVYVTMVVIASAVTAGGTVKLQGSADGTNWYDIATRAVSANGTTADSVAQAHRYVRTNVTARTDGTYTTYVTIGGPNDGAWFGGE